MNKSPQDYLALALDNFETLDQLRVLVNQTKESIGMYKVGLEQFTRFGVTALNVIKENGKKVFLDLKFHDIPNTVSKAVRSASELGIDYLTIHTQGGSEMMKAAAGAAKEAQLAGFKPPKIVGVTVLTSIDQNILNNELKVNSDVGSYVVHLAKMAADSGLDGIVCSAADLPMVKPHVPEGFEIITPGIRPAGSGVQDQKRVATPKDAIENGATLLVIGRPITGAKDPGEAAREIYLNITDIVGILEQL